MRRGTLGSGLRLLLAFALLATAAGCSSLSGKLCGGDGLTCCENQKCDVGLVCGDSNKCQACGTEGATCCSGQRCEVGLSCQANVCQGCGAAGGACCPGTNACALGLRCVQGKCDCGGACTPGEQRCTATNGIEICAQPAEACPSWSTVVQSCAAGSVCRGDAGVPRCEERCPEPCTPGSSVCSSIGGLSCVQPSGSDCPSWVPSKDVGTSLGCYPGGCTPAGTCWESPTPLGTTLRRAAGDSDEDFYVVDVVGNVLHLVQGTWRYEVRATTTARVQAISFCGTGLMAAVGTNGLSLRKGSTGWQPDPSPLTGVITAVGCDAKRTIVATTTGRIAGRDENAGWRELSAGTAAPVNAVSYYPFGGAGYLLGPNGRIVRCAPIYDVANATCAVEANGLTTAELSAGWSEIDTPTDVSYAVGNGVILERRFGGWDALDAGVGPAVWLGAHASKTQLFVVGTNGAFVSRTRQGQFYPSLPFTTADLFDVLAGTTQDDPVVAVGEHGGIWMHPYGAVENPSSNLWKQLGGKGPITADLLAVAGQSADDLYAVGRQGHVYRRRADQWRREAEGLTTADLHAVVVRSSLEAYAVGANGTVLARHKGTWRKEAVGLTTARLFAVATDGLTITAVGEGGVWLERPAGDEAAAWVKVEQGASTATLFALAVVGTEVAAVGMGCTVVSKKAGAFSASTVSGCSGALLGAVALGTSLFVAGDNGFASQRAPSGAWQREYPPTAEHLQGATQRNGQLWVVSATGQVLRRTGTTWSNEDPWLTSVPLYGAAAPVEGGTYVVGAGGTVLRFP